MEYHDQIHFLTKNGFKIYPKIKLSDRTNRFAVCVEDPKRLVFEKLETVGGYKHTSRSLNRAIEETVRFVYGKLIEKGFPARPPGEETGTKN